MLCEQLHCSACCMNNVSFSLSETRVFSCSSCHCPAPGQRHVCTYRYSHLPTRWQRLVARGNSTGKLLISILLSILLALQWKIHVIFKYIYLIKHRRKASEIIASHLLSDALAMRAVWAQQISAANSATPGECPGARTARVHPRCWGCPCVTCRNICLAPRPARCSQDVGVPPACLCHCPTPAALLLCLVALTSLWQHGSSVLPLVPFGRILTNLS